MKISNFSSKTVIFKSNIKSIATNIPLSKKISTDLYNSFDVSFSGVYKIGSITDKKDCYIGSSYNIGLAVRNHFNLLLANKHHSKSLQEWVNKNGIEALDFSILAWCPPRPDTFKEAEQKFINKLHPRFNSTLNVFTPRETEIIEERRYWKPTRVFVDMVTGEVTRTIGYTTGKQKRKVEVVESVVVRNNIFKPKPNI
jgi:hypothetical protein